MTLHRRYGLRAAIVLAVLVALGAPGTARATPTQPRVHAAQPVSGAGSWAMLAIGSGAAGLVVLAGASGFVLLRRGASRSTRVPPA